MIGDDIEITVVDIRGDKIRLGIEAPLDVAVHRKEVYEAIRLENEQAAALDLAELKPLHISPGNIDKTPAKTKKGRDRGGGGQVLRSNKAGRRTDGRNGSRSRRNRTA